MAAAQVGQAVLEEVEDERPSNGPSMVPMPPMTTMTIIIAE
ncbi:hypothetical protein ACI784_08975 [Geodermatophilus sp. SYSU D01186]